jgi:hypothetical protein
MKNSKYPCIFCGDACDPDIDVYVCDKCDDLFVSCKDCEEGNQLESFSNKHLCEVCHTEERK